MLAQFQKFYDGFCNIFNTDDTLVMRYPPIDNDDPNIISPFDKDMMYSKDNKNKYPKIPTIYVGNNIISANEYMSPLLLDALSNIEYEFINRRYFSMFARWLYAIQCDGDPYEVYNYKNTFKIINLRNDITYTRVFRKF